MLGADLVRARRRGETLTVQALKAADREAALEMGTSLLETVAACLGETAEDVSEAVSATDRESRHEKLFLGLKKLVLDDCEFGSPLEMDAVNVRKLVFERSSQLRQELPPGEALERESVLEAVAQQLEVTSEQVEEGLFSDLKGAQRMTSFPKVSPEALVDRYELSQLQGVLLKAVRMTVVVECKRPDAYRALFQKLKFRQLLFRLEESETGYRIEIEGPFSLFESVTKYGLQLALLVPALLACDKGELTADLKWGKERRPLQFTTKWKQAIQGTEREELRSEVQALVQAIEKKGSEFEVEVASDILHILGIGLCIPDLKFSAPGRKPVFLEVLGFWSREAVWNRVEWAQAGGHEPVVFAASSRLRVSEEVLPDDNEACLYVYKAALSAPAILKRVKALATPL